MTATCASLAVASTITAQDLPSRRAHHALAYDPVKRVVLMTGGSTPQDGGKSSAFFNDLWAFDGRSWTPLPPSGNKLSGDQAGIR